MEFETVMFWLEVGVMIISGGFVVVALVTLWRSR